MVDLKDEDVTKGLAGCAILLLLPLLIPYRAWAIMTLWTWFVVPLGVPELTLKLAAGISLLSANLTYQLQFDDSRPSTTTVLITQLLHPLLIVGLGYLIQRFIP